MLGNEIQRKVVCLEKVKEEVEFIMLVEVSGRKVMSPLYES